MRLWDLPTPSRLLDDLVRTLDSGRSALVIRPRRPALDGLDLALSRRVRRHWRVVNLRRDARAGTMLHRLHERLGLEGSSANADFNAVVTDPSVAGQLLWIDLGDDVDPRDVSHFVTEFAAACARHGESDPPALVLCVELRWLDPVPVNDTALAVRWWWGRVGPLDTRVVVDAAMAPVRVLGDVDVVAEVAGFDLDLARTLAESHSGDVVADLRAAVTEGWAVTEPATLEHIAATSPADLDQPPLAIRPQWATGAVDWWGEQPVLHAGCVLEHALAELEVRIWRGQVAAIFPFLEVHRGRLARWVDGRRHQLRGGWDSRDLLALDVGPMHKLFRDHPRLQQSRAAWEVAQALADSRHRLAHMEALDRGWFAQREQVLRRAVL